MGSCWEPKCFTAPRGGGTVTCQKILFKNIPAELLELDQWVCQRKKIPHSPQTGKQASSSDPATWGSFEEAKGRLDKDRVFEGIGFVFFS